MAKKKKKNIKKRQISRLYDLEIDEVSLVDKPAIGEEVYLFKSMTKKNIKPGGDNVAKPKPVKKSLTNWKGTVQKSQTKSTHCVFCGITHEEEAKSMGIGLLCNVCFECALEYFDKGVFAACVEGTFNVEEFQKENPDIKLKIKLEDSDDDDDENSDEDDENSDEDDENSDEDDEDDENSDEDDDDENSNKGDNPDDSATSGDNDNDDNGSNETIKNLSEKVDKLEKNLGDVMGMLESQLELHDIAAGALNEVLSLTFASLDALMSLMESSEDETTQAALSEIQEKIESGRKAIQESLDDVEKRGAKISAGRMNVLREIAEKLTQLIESVVTDSEKGIKEKAQELQKSLEADKEEVQTSISKNKKDIETISKKLEELEESGGMGSSIEDDEDDEEDEENSNTSKGKDNDVFKGAFGDLPSQIKKKASRK